MRFISLMLFNKSYGSMLRILILFALVSTHFINSQEWCKVASDGPETRYEDNRCQIAIYLINSLTHFQMVKLIRHISLMEDITFKIVGEGKHTNPITLVTNNGTIRRQLVERLDVGELRSLELKLNDSNWSCEKIVIYKGSRFWIFDCIPSSSLNSDEHVTTYLLSGNKMYTVNVQTGGQKDAGSSGTIAMTLLGTSGRTNQKTLSNAFYSASYLTFQLKGLDVGEVNGLILSNDAINDPWYCDNVRVTYNEIVKSFPVKRWVGYPFDPSVEISTEELTSIANLNETSPFDIMCNTRAIDIYSGVINKPFNITVRCPLNCQTDPLMAIEGSSLHPSSTSICGASLFDGVITNSGGEVVISIGQPVRKYFGGTRNNLKSEDYEPAGDSNLYSFFTFLNGTLPQFKPCLESIDNIDKTVRLVDGFGKLTSFGRLEVFRNGRWGTVCTKGKRSMFNNQSAKLVCNNLGFKYGIYIKENCSSINNQNLCAPPGYHVSCAGLACLGEENDLSNCIFEDPTIDCRNHKEDVVVKCTNFSPTSNLEYGTLRIVDSSGATSSTGTGRLEMYNNGEAYSFNWILGFGTVCSESWTKDAEKIACLEMGYTGLRNGGASDKACSDFHGLNLCGPVLKKIAANGFKCNGGESQLKDCEHESGDDIYCTHEQDVLVSCEGNGDPSEFRNFKKVEPFVAPMKKWTKLINLSCYDTLTSHSEFEGEFGSYKVATCPMGCMDEPASIKGTYVYTRDSSICKAAIHSGVLDNSGGDIVVINAYSQQHFYGTTMNGVQSMSLSKGVEDFKEKAFMVSKPTRYIMSKQEKAKSESPISTRFNGSATDYVNTKDLPGSKLLKTFRDATFIFEIIPTGGVGKWSTIFSFENCGGLVCSIDNQGELVLQEKCKPDLVKTSYFPIVGKRAYVAVLYYVLTKDLSVFVDGAPVANQPTNFDLNFEGDLILGKLAEADSDYFTGHILGFQAFDYVMSPEQIRQQYASSQANDGFTSHLSSVRMTTEGNVCLTKCVKKYTGKYEKYSNVTNPAIALSCSDTIESESFNGPTGKSFLVSCTKSCLNSDVPLKGSKLYTSDTSICKAALHSGVIPKEGGEAILTVLSGLGEYGQCHGHYGITSQKSNIAFMRSFTLHRAPKLMHLSCQDTAVFVLKMHPGTRVLLECPPGCLDMKPPNVFGTDSYSPMSSLCQAAIHSGKLDNEGGEVEIEVDGKKNSFDSSESNGILSQSSGQYLKSFKVLKVRKKIG
ncbi:uncharacterized protein TOT_040000133 [Theileria orientalis strain Shintoku]|uniref:Uncharacterized protein n=1 Tax=Theileria orientalis strain Shintoku TaxID=869250 RepID=J4C486_THEOR|nr:uncharacterized protein TOT_040000133 [Theileria orientalis strain Shintoku]BAM41751.1 uncharacterized protein TOT_040000133 [Theileria orientalis strain Shintoku]|eukprot:XP_009692052.1 uncharacterized protein TOT_040000133 [Theileria orientalis strain Shintoku]